MKNRRLHGGPVRTPSSLIRPGITFRFDTETYCRRTSQARRFAHERPLRAISSGRPTRITCIVIRRNNRSNSPGRLHVVGRTAAFRDVRVVLQKPHTHVRRFVWAVWATRNFLGNQKPSTAYAKSAKCTDENNDKNSNNGTFIIPMLWLANTTVRVTTRRAKSSVNFTGSLFDLPWYLRTDAFELSPSTKYEIEIPSPVIV